MRKRRNRQISGLKVETMAANGYGLARHEGKVVFVEKTVPGDVVDVKLIKNKSDYAQGFPIVFHERSSLRSDAFCEHFGTCGGCVWQDVQYDDQLNLKHQLVADAFRRTGKLFDLPEIKPVLPAPFSKYYRNKLEYTFSSNRWITEEEKKQEDEISNRDALGFHIPRRFDKILDIEHCYLQASPSNEIRLSVRAYAKLTGLSFYNINEHTGYLRNLIIRTSSTGEVMVILIVAEDNPKVTTALMKHLCSTFEEITSAYYSINTKLNDSIYDLEMIHFDGSPYMVEQLNGVKYELGPKSFFQTNSYQAEALYSLAIEMANIKTNDIVYDLYTGIGSIALQFAKSCNKVIGVESVEDAVKDADRNAHLNKIDNCTFISGDMAKIFNNEFIVRYGAADVVITDPPRAGMHKDVCSTLLDLAPRKIVYISCNPVTQARDIQLLSEKYTVTQIQPVDMFPHTYHIENIACLELK